MVWIQDRIVAKNATQLVLVFNLNLSQSRGFGFDLGGYDINPLGVKMLFQSGQYV